MAHNSALYEDGTQGKRRDVNRNRELRLRTLVSDTERDVKIARRHEGALAIIRRLLRTRDVAVGELAAELENRTVGPVLRHLERGGHRDGELVLVLVPDAVAGRIALGVGRLDLHPVVAEHGVDGRRDGEEVLREGVAQVERRHQRDGVVTARDGNPRVVVGGERTLEARAYFEVVALLADGGPLGAVACPVEVGQVDRRGLELVAEGHLLLFGIHLVNRYLGGGRKGQAEGREQQQRSNVFHNEAVD